MEPYVVEFCEIPIRLKLGLHSEDQALLHQMKIRLIVVLYSDWIRQPEKVKADILKVIER